MTVVGYLGPEGSYSQMALEKYAASSTDVIQPKPFESFFALFEGLQSSQCDEIIIPIENSIEGFVSTNLDLLRQDTHTISREIVVEIMHYLFSLDRVAPEEIQVIASHPQALAQCATMIRARFPNATTYPTLSTSAAIDYLGNRQDVAIIGSAKLGKLHPHLYQWPTPMTDFATNFTRFVVVSKTKSASTGHDKTSIVFQAQKDRPGILHQILGEFASRQINLTEITSRPTKQELGEYLFFVDFEGHVDDTLVQDALAAIGRHTSQLRWLGSYPKTI